MYEVKLGKMTNFKTCFKLPFILEFKDMEFGQAYQIHVDSQLKYSDGNF